MDKNNAIEVDHVGMKFNMSSEKVDNLKDYVIKALKHELMYKEFWALRDVTFNVKKGDRVGIVGLNGAGKSTLLKVVSGVLKPTEGSVRINGSERALTSSTRALKIFIYMGPCLDILRNSCRKNTTRS